MYWFERNLLLVSLVVLTLGFARVATASVVASDSFTYDPADSAVEGMSGGTGWAAAWHSVASVLVVDPTTNLVANEIDGGNRALQHTVSDDNAAYRSLANPFADSDLFFSYLFRFDAGEINANDFLTLWFDNVTTGNHITMPNMGLKSNSGSGTADSPDYFVRFANGSEVYSAHQAQVGETVQVVGRLQKTAASPTFSQIDLWINPATNSLATPDASVTGDSSLSEINVIGFRTFNLSGQDRLLVDELLLGTSFSDVVRTIVPEPSALLVWAVMVAICVISARRSCRAKPPK